MIDRNEAQSRVKKLEAELANERAEIIRGHDLIEKLESELAALKASGEISADAVEWVVNDNSELGVKIGNQFFFLYKGDSLVYETGKHDDGSAMHWRTVGKREFGECCHPINYSDPTRTGTVSLDDSDRWADLPPAKAKPSPIAEPGALRPTREQDEHLIFTAAYEMNYIAACLKDGTIPKISAEVLTSLKARAALGKEGS
jgi:hypothetical protein